MDHARGCQGAQGKPSTNKGKWISGPRTRTSNNEQVTFPKEPNFLGKRSEGLEPDHLANIGQEATILGRISFKEMSQ